MHGGPTGMASAAHAPVHGYWCRMGMAVLQVNHRGSTGFGRRYRDALLGAWGIAEVEDCETLIDWLVQRRMVDPSRIAIRGSSAGGYTALRAATTSRRFAAATAAYGVADLRVLQHTTHKFESCYLEGLLGTSDPGSDAFVSRSPVNAKAVHCPVLMLHGCEDRIVPVEQSRLMVQRIQALKGAGLLCEFASEGHGFLDPINRQIALALETDFYRALFLDKREQDTLGIFETLAQLQRHHDGCRIQTI